MGKHLIQPTIIGIVSENEEHPKLTPYQIVPLQGDGPYEVEEPIDSVKPQQGTPKKPHKPFPEALLPELVKVETPEISTNFCSLSMATRPTKRASCRSSICNIPMSPRANLQIVSRILPRKRNDQGFPR